eukprot:CAMPEP_0115831932 /NCGR_PEP_ID=MMETSP0287-20121206/2393_1 /TAXON_ID=412157 /ORGANISM="Chrysochromulina rotalis, Strain UIO044" /LENGTH=43 /DNA_ID= /DNA_START= /DNA_END= /DNA_ORIENTATION=
MPALEAPTTARPKDTRGISSYYAPVFSQSTILLHMIAGELIHL